MRLSVRRVSTHFLRDVDTLSVSSSRRGAAPIHQDTFLSREVVLHHPLDSRQTDRPLTLSSLSGCRPPSLPRPSPPLSLSSLVWLFNASAPKRFCRHEIGFTRARKAKRENPFLSFPFFLSSAPAATFPSCARALSQFILPNTLTELT